MISQRMFGITTAVVLGMALSACGGGAGGGVISTPALVAASPPSPPVNNSPSASKYDGPTALQSAEPFAAAGYGTRFSIDAAGTNPKLLGGPEAGDSISFRQLPGTNQYELKLPGYQLGVLTPIYYNGTVCSDGTVCKPSSISSRVTVGTSDLLQDALVNVPVPGSNYPDPALTYTSLVRWNGQSPDPANANRELRSEGVFAYGIPTAVGDVPTTGTGTYSAKVEGRTNDIGNLIEGTASLSFNFALGTLSGEMRPTISDGWDLQPLGVYAFTRTVFGVGNTTFSGAFDGPVSGGGFEGRFTGPQAAELLARWQAPFTNIDKTPGTMFGVWVGKRQ